MIVAISPLAGQPAPKEMLIDLARLEREYLERRPDVGDADEDFPLPVVEELRRRTASASARASGGGNTKGWEADSRRYRRGT